MTRSAGPLPARQASRDGWIDRHRYLFVAAVAVWGALPLALFAALPWPGRHAADLAHLAREVTLGAGVLAVLLATRARRRDWGHPPRREWRDLWAMWPIAGLVALIWVAGLAGGLDPDHVKIAIQVPTYAVTGFLEETEYRGFILGALVLAWAGYGRRGQLAAIAASAALFAAAHLGNLGDQPTAVVINQVVYTFVFGVGFAAIRLRTRTLRPLIAVHAAMDILGALTPSTPTTGLTLGVLLSGQLPSLLLAGYGLFLLRRVPPAPDSAGAMQPS
jgi:membrane protease YdiL (CAAX protease family)